MHNFYTSFCAAPYPAAQYCNDTYDQEDIHDLSGAGAAFAFWDGDWTVVDSVFADNVAPVGGGAVYVRRCRLRVGEVPWMDRVCCIFCVSCVCLAATNVPTPFVLFARPASRLLQVAMTINNANFNDDNFAFDLTVNNCTFERNKVAADARAVGGAAVYFGAFSFARIFNSTFRGNVLPAGAQGGAALHNAVNQIWPIPHDPDGMVRA